MPASATITSFYSFTPKTRLKNSEMDANFDALRGHMLPIDPNTGTAGISGEWDFGALEYRWATTFVKGLNFGLTTTAELSLDVNAAGQIYLGNDIAAEATTVRYLITATQTGSLIFLEQTFTHNQDYGFIGVNVNDDTEPYVCDTTTVICPVGSVAFGSGVGWTITGTGNLDGSTLTMMTNGRPVVVTLQAQAARGASGGIRFYRDYTSSSVDSFVDFGLWRDGVLVAKTSITKNYSLGYTAGSERALTYPPSHLKLYDNPPKGQHSYWLSVDRIETLAYYTGATISGANVQVWINNCKSMAYEL